MVLQTPAGPFSQNRLLLSLTPSSSVMNHCRRARAAGSSAEGSPHARPVWRATCLYEAAAESASGSIGLRGGSYCRRPSSARGRAANSLQIRHNPAATLRKFAYIWPDNHIYGCVYLTPSMTLI